ncbi:MAG: glycosyltransferase family 4 protein [Clostridia bacterium]|nr:glycosyltransferase family 4 protein [Clostridia bacterium]
MKKILFVSNISKRINTFSAAAITAAHSTDLSFHYAANWSQAPEGQIAADEQAYNIHINNVAINRSPFSRSNIKAYRQIVELIKREKIDYIHCNTPVGGLLGRLAGKKCKVEKVIYQVHGFHFYKGAPRKHWLLYYPIEKWLARKTDAIVTINTEDYAAAQKLKLKKGGKVYFVHGVGIDSAAFASEHISNGAVRRELGIAESDLMLISAGELNQNKNNKVILTAMAKTAAKNIHYVLCGVGPLREELEALAKNLGIANRVHFLGYRTDIPVLYSEADAFVMPSYREGLSRSMMEAMASGLPCLASRIRGNVDLIEDGKGGYLCPATDDAAFADALTKLASNSELRAEMRAYNLEKIKEYDISVVEKEIEAIYQEVLNK